MLRRLEVGKFGCWGSARGNVKTFDPHLNRLCEGGRARLRQSLFNSCILKERSLLLDKPAGEKRRQVKMKLALLQIYHLNRLAKLTHLQATEIDARINASAVLVQSIPFLEM